MKIYAAISGDTSHVIEIEYPSLLVSFAFDADASFFDKLPYSPPNRLGDSGAFTVWTQGKTVDRDRLIEWCVANVEKHPTFQCISLDVIPGQAGGNRKPTKRERTTAFRQSLENGDAMRAAGLRIMEVFHVYEDIEHLDQLLDRRQPGEGIALGGMVGRSLALKRAFCDQAFSHVRDRLGGWDKIPPIHGLGIAPRHGSKEAIAWRYPWASIDSTSWLNPSKYGEVISRAGVHGKSDGRVAHRAVAHQSIERLLNAWARRERESDYVWQRRGVTWDA